MREILFKGINKVNKENMIFYKPILDKIENDKYQIKKLKIKPKILIPKKDLYVQDIFLPLSLQNKKSITEEIKNKKNNPYCATEVINEKENKKELNYYKKLNILPKIKEKRNIYLGMNKFSLNLNQGTALSCGKINSEKYNSKDTNEINDRVYQKLKKLPFKEISLNKNKSEKRQRIIKYSRVKIGNNYNTIKKPEKNLHMNDIIISNDFHGSKILNIRDYLKINNKINKYHQLIKRNIYNTKNDLSQSKSYKAFKPNDSEKNDSVETSINNNNKKRCVLINNNKRTNFKSFDMINKAKVAKKITETISDISNINSIDNTKKINYQKYIPTKKKNNNDDIINLLENINN